MTDEEFLLDHLISINLRRTEARKLWEQWEREGEEFRVYTEVRRLAEKEALDELWQMAWKTVQVLDQDARRTVDELKRRLRVKAAAALQEECRQIDGRD